jgi:hypothetical protein
MFPHKWISAGNEAYGFDLGKPVSGESTMILLRLGTMDQFQCLSSSEKVLTCNFAMDQFKIIHRSRVIQKNCNSFGSE